MHGTKYFSTKQIDCRKNFLNRFAKCKQGCKLPGHNPCIALIIMTGFYVYIHFYKSGPIISKSLNGIA